METPEQLKVAIDDFENWGLILLSGRLSPQHVARYRNILERLGSQIDPGWETRHPDLVINDVISYDPQLVDLVDDPLVLSLVLRMLGDNIYVYMSEAISRSAGNPDQSEDPAEPDGRNPTGAGLRFHQDSDGIERDLKLPVAPRLSVKAGFYLTDAHHAGCGNTWVVPGSHRIPLADQTDSADGLHHDQGIPILASAGDVLIFDRRLWHGGSPNDSPNTRHAVFIGYAFRWLRPRFDTRLPDSIDSDSVLRQQLLGTGTTKGRYEAPDSEIPLKLTSQAHSLPAHPHQRASAA
ncbi:phytanoyl-CoA dioxygenase family protein [Catellatospora tritici]|uniref:phytanoyl-CoA dioxygenase family protein n=1 Tax=Catellatospora tritici TaxID=2851566 RepID=UPI001C2DEF8F|nr:phytanoyl-CoA dioxygenase family protein [Catellatospora tritici]MBV1855769.1 phytanoyl-CoA dioxygenase family protein [Catellatospora tritici]